MTRFAALLAAVSIAAGAAAAGELAGVSLPDQDSAADRALVLNGMGLREATVLKVDVYVAGLYLETRASDAETILRSDQAKRIRMHFVRNVGRADLVKAWEEGFANNLGDIGPYRAGLAKLSGAMVDMKKGDEIVITTVPGEGATITVKGKDAARIEDEAFAGGIWSLWLGPKPPNPGLKTGLLGGAKN